MHQCKRCLRWYETENDLMAHSQSLFVCRRYDLDAIAYWAARNTSVISGKPVYTLPPKPSAHMLRLSRNRKVVAMREP